MRPYDELKEIVRDRLEQWPPERVGYHWPGYTYDHTLRVINLSVAMAAAVGADERITRYAALLHDIAKPEGDRHAEIGAEQARQIMKQYDLQTAFVNRVTSAIGTHAGGIGEGDPMENLILSDADFIDANFGLVGTWRFITIRGGRGDKLDDIVAGMAEWLGRKEELAMRLNTDCGSQIARQRMDRMQAFCDHLRVRFSGSANGHDPQVWLARFIHEHSEAGRLQQQVACLLGDSVDLPEGVPALVEQLALEVEGHI